MGLRSFYMKSFFRNLIRQTPVPFISLHERTYALMPEKRGPVLTLA